MTKRKKTAQPKVGNNIALILAAIVFSATAGGISGAVWNGNGDGASWSDPANWSNNQVPGNGANVEIGFGDVLLADTTANLNSLTMTSGTLTFTNWDTTLRALEINLSDGATLTHVQNTADEPDGEGVWPREARVKIECANLYLAADAMIDVSEKGYKGGDTEDGGNILGRGPSEATTWSLFGAGAGHGGPGGLGRSSSSTHYGDVFAPDQPGSGGGGRNSGPGGGLVHIEATGTVTVNGIINADARNGITHGGGGSGGAVYISCNIFAGSAEGLITATGGNSPAGNSGSGAGGRIAVHYNTSAQAQMPAPGVRFNLEGGFHPTDPARKGYTGTLYLPDTALFTPNLANFEDVRIYGPESWTITSLVFTNNFIAFAQTNFNLTVNGDLIIDGGRLTIGGGRMFNTERRRLGPEMSHVEYVEVNCGRLVLTNSGSLVVNAGSTNETITEWGARVIVKGDFFIGTGSWGYPTSNATNGGSVYFRANSLHLEEDAGFDADYRGYITGHGPGMGGRWSAFSGGAGHGGYGGGDSSANNRYGGPPYSYATAPIMPGSSTTGSSSGSGGGLIWVDVNGPAHIDGIMTADGMKSPAHGGGGSGGGILVACKKLTGSGLLRADGGDGQYETADGGGAGGRIAVWHRIPESDRQLILADPDNTASNLKWLFIKENFEDTDFAGSTSLTYGTARWDGEPGTLAVLSPKPEGSIIHFF